MALVSEPRKGKSVSGKSASWTVPQISHADNRVEVTAGSCEARRTSGGVHQQPALRTEVALGTIVQTKSPAAFRPPGKYGEGGAPVQRAASIRFNAVEMRDENTCAAVAPASILALMEVGIDESF